MRLGDFKVLTFDMYGTLIDWETGLHAALAPLAARAGREIPRAAVLDGFAAWEIVQQRTTPAARYADLLAVVAKRVTEEWDVHASWEECEILVWFQQRCFSHRGQSAVTAFDVV